MTSTLIPQVKDVDIDENGNFKYILIKLSCTNEGEQIEKLLVRGYADCPYHTDINDKMTDELLDLKGADATKDWQAKVLGGGKINHDPDNKIIKVYSYSQGYGKADHQLAVDLLKKVYADYDITISNED